MNSVAPSTTELEELSGMALESMVEPGWITMWGNKPKLEQPQITYTIRDEERNETVSCLRIFWRMLETDKRRLRVVGIGGVWTWPARRGQGYATVLLDKVLDKLRETAKSADVVILCASQTRGLYSHLGFLEVGEGLYGVTLHEWEDCLHQDKNPYVWKVVPEGHF